MSIKIKGFKDERFITGKKFYKYNKWKCANTYDRNYAEPPNKPGIYFIIGEKISYGGWWHQKERLCYIGSSSKLKQRYKSHEIFKKLKGSFDYVGFYFLELNKNWEEVERRFIKFYRPPYNKRVI